jgi:hypothetical protein
MQQCGLDHEGVPIQGRSRCKVLIDFQTCWCQLRKIAGLDAGVKRGQGHNWILGPCDDFLVFLLALSNAARTMDGSNARGQTINIVLL